VPALARLAQSGLYLRARQGLGLFARH
jgi:hypothetical protein